MTVKITIGEMAKLHGISTQTLRYYDRIDLFKPSYTNSETGYRYYGVEQFAHLESILFLKGMGMSLQDIKEYFKNRELSSMLKLMQERVIRIDNEITNLELKREKMLVLFATVNNYLNKNILGKCRLQQMPERSILFFHFGEGDMFTEHEFGIKKLENAVENVDELYLNPFGTVIGREQLESGNYDVFKGIAMVFDSRYNERQDTQPLQKGNYATLAFIGTYKDISRYCSELVGWIYQNGYDISGDGIVLVITDKAYSDYEYEYISEIQIPIKKRK
jgi:DNA-binding transcriptional MerR regulator